MVNFIIILKVSIEVLGMIWKFWTCAEMFFFNLISSITDKTTSFKITPRIPFYGDPFKVLEGDKKRMKYYIS